VRICVISDSNIATGSALEAVRSVMTVSKPSLLPR